MAFIFEHFELVSIWAAGHRRMGKKDWGLAYFVPLYHAPSVPVFLYSPHFYPLRVELFFCLYRYGCGQ